MQGVGAEGFVCFLSERSLGRDGGEPENKAGKLERVQEHISPHSEDAAWKKALPGLSHLFARCGFAVF